MCEKANALYERVVAMDANIEILLKDLSKRFAEYNLQLTVIPILINLDEKIES